ncbi:MAG: glutamine--fructose-6-phosphate transaminase (isomerizing) [Alphaproteobacteria bacterium]
MCGIVGIISGENVVPRLVEGLRRLEYRGYDSAGIATTRDGKIDRRRAEGKLNNLEEHLKESPIAGTIGIGHTRWATHGVPNQSNAHPHSDGIVTVVHNGIIENFRELRTMLENKGATFESETDTEAVVHLISSFVQEGASPTEAFQKTLPLLKGAFALVVLFKDEANKMFCARRGSPLAIGHGKKEMFVGSDALALAPLTKKICYLEEGDYAVIDTKSARIFDENNQAVSRKVQKTEFSGALIGKGEYRHFMQKEIFEQPVVAGDCLHSFLNPATRKISLPKDVSFDFSEVNKITIIACGTSFYAAMVAKYWLEQTAKISVEIDIASEFRYRRPVMEKGGLVICVSQSGETADTVAALKYAKAAGQKIISVVNVPESTMSRESDATFLLHAGPEIGVASTKAFTTQLMVLACLTLVIAREKKAITAAAEKELTKALSEVPAKMSEILESDKALRKTAHKLENVVGTLYIGRGLTFPIALEGALKLKELAYIHAEGYAAGEMKHGPIALIDETLPVIVLAPTDALFEKTVSNMQEVQARGGQVILFTDAEGQKHLGNQDGLTVHLLPEMNSFVTPLLYSLPVQMLAYHAAALKGTDVDQPRNLAKSVTVE